MKHIILGTGIECSMPKVKGGKRRDILEETGHYTHYRQEFSLCKKIGAKYLRYGIPYYQAHTGPDTYNWSLCDQLLEELQQKRLIPILDICHYGVPDWIGDFQNKEWPRYFAQFCAAFAERYPWIRFYTPINEMFVLAKFNGRDGLWNERLESDDALTHGLLIIIEAAQRAMKAILKVNPDAAFIPCEAAEILHEQWPSTHERVELENHLVHSTYDLLFGHPLFLDARQFLFHHGLTENRYRAFLRRGKELKPHCIMGLNYFSPSERILLPNGKTDVSPAAVGWNSIARGFYERHQMPFLLSETNNLGSEAEAGPDWLWKMWHQVESLRGEGLPVLGLIWYSLKDQLDWDTLLQEIRHTTIPVGLYDKDFKPNPVEPELHHLLKRYSQEPLLPDNCSPEIKKWPALQELD